jgi:hypothetical protein
LEVPVPPAKVDVEILLYLATDGHPDAQAKVAKVFSITED